MGILVGLGFFLQRFNTYGVVKTIPWGLNICNKDTKQKKESHRDSMFLMAMLNHLSANKKANKEKQLKIFWQKKQRFTYQYYN